MIALTGRAPHATLAVGKFDMALDLRRATVKHVTREAGQVSRPTSRQLPDELRTRLEAESRRVDASVQSVAISVLDEGLRVRHFPGITFRDGPTGRRAGLANGPDVWEIIRDLHSAPGDHAARTSMVREQAALSMSAITLAEQYYAQFPSEIDLRIEQHYRCVEELLKLDEPTLNAAAASRSEPRDGRKHQRRGISM